MASLNDPSHAMSRSSAYASIRRSVENGLPSERLRLSKISGSKSKRHARAGWSQCRNLPLRRSETEVHLRVVGYCPRLLKRIFHIDIEHCPPS